MYKIGKLQIGRRNLTRPMEIGRPPQLFKRLFIETEKNGPPRCGPNPGEMLECNVMRTTGFLYLVSVFFKFIFYLHRIPRKNVFQHL